MSSAVLGVGVGVHCSGAKLRDGLLHAWALPSKTMTSCGPGWLVVVRPELKDRFKERVSIRSRDALWFHIVFDPVPAAIEMRLSDTIGQWIWSSATVRFV